MMIPYRKLHGQLFTPGLKVTLHREGFLIHRLKPVPVPNDTLYIHTDNSSDWANMFLSRVRLAPNMVIYVQCDRGWYTTNERSHARSLQWRGIMALPQCEWLRVDRRQRLELEDAAGIWPLSEKPGFGAFWYT